MKAVVCKGSLIVSHELSLELSLEAPETYKYFGARESGWIKVVP